MGKITANLCFKYINIVYHEQRHYRTQKWLYMAFLLVLLTIYCCSLWGGPIFCSDERSGKESSSLKYMCNGVSVIFTDGCNNIVSSETPCNVALCVSLEFIWISYCFFSQGWLHHLPWLVHHLQATCLSMCRRQAHLFQLMVSDGWSWVASVPTLLSHEALNQLLTPGMHARATASSGATAPLCCPIERFLGCVFFGDTCTGFSSQRKARKLPLQATTSRVGSDDDLIHCSIFC